MTRKSVSSTVCWRCVSRALETLGHPAEVVTVTMPKVMKASNRGSLALPRAVRKTRFWEQALGMRGRRWTAGQHCTAWTLRPWVSGLVHNSHKGRDLTQCVSPQEGLSLSTCVFPCSAHPLHPLPSPRESLDRRSPFTSQASAECPGLRRAGKLFLRAAVWRGHSSKYEGTQGSQSPRRGWQGHLRGPGLQEVYTGAAWAEI